MSTIESDQQVHRPSGDVYIRALAELLNSYFINYVTPVMVQESKSVRPIIVYDRAIKHVMSET
jgi:hypothetical protein